jgi:hypothetical protein
MMRFVRWFRVRRPVCPACNSDAPALDDCRVCEGYSTTYHGLPTPMQREQWMMRHEARKCEHGTPLLLGMRCAECDEWLHRHCEAAKNRPNPRCG